MKRKTKIRKGNKGSKGRKGREWQKSYPASYLVIILVGLLLLEALAFSFSVGNWVNGLTVLDVSEQVELSIRSTNIALHPMAVVAADINQFYKLAAIATIELIRPAPGLEISDLGLAVAGVIGFYEQGSKEVESLLDMSDLSGRIGRVAGVSTENF